MSTPSVPVVGIAWYRLKDYERVMEVMADGASFPKTHASWLLKAMRMERELKRQGSVPVRIQIDPALFERWCAQRGLAPDSEARNRFVADAIAQQRVSSS